MKYKNILTIFLGMTLSLSSAVAEFSDVEGHVYAEAIAYVESEGIVNGYPDGTFRPDVIINRAEFVKIITAAIYDSQAIEGCGNIEFSDVASDQWFSTYVCIAQQNNIVGGYPDGTFRPAANINFVEAAKIIVNAFGYEVQTYEEAWFRGYVEALETVSAIPSSVVSFEHSMTRGEMAEVIMRVRAKNTTKPTRTYSELAVQAGLEVGMGDDNGHNTDDENNEEGGDHEGEMTLEAEVMKMMDMEVIPMEDQDQEGEMLKTGTFAPAEYQTSGMAFVKTTSAGQMLRLENFAVTNGPDLRVYLSSDLTAAGGIEVGTLKSASGSMNYDLSSELDVELYPNVLIWCEPYGVLFGSALLEG